MAIPAKDKLKENYDVAASREKYQVKIIMIIRNYRSGAVAALTQNITFLHSVETIEALVARSALIFAKELGFNCSIELFVKLYGLSWHNQ